MSATEDTKKEDELIDKDTLIYIGAGAGLLGLVGVIAMAGMGWMKEQDREKKKIEMQKQQLAMAQRALQERPPESGWPNPIPRNTIQQRPPANPVMELPSENEEYDTGHFVNAYSTNDQQKFVVTDDITRPKPYPIIDPNAPPQQIGSKVSRVMSLDNDDYPVQQQRQVPPPIPRNNSVGDDEDISDLF